MAIVVHAVCDEVGCAVKGACSVGEHRLLSLPAKLKESGVEFQFGMIL
jgi:hypothetical protein